ncbi:ribonuclease HI family protein [Undibacterium fentianense]|uniref:Ribonuclease HI family protein n=1 Tax=Undibacterium fentianense TaxID=2828728 RepID=A0A941IEM1_9BURK|nr:ribonuclease HI family protein [Undibacterium fentianense]MBR7801258.1 ribonuclease HI family protein [Undibacterium fentianense]
MLEQLLPFVFHREHVFARRLAQRQKISLEQAYMQVLLEVAKPLAVNDLLAQRRAQQQQIVERKQSQQQESKRRFAMKLEQTVRMQSDPNQPAQKAWRAWFDGSASPNPGECSIGVLLLSPFGERWEVSRAIGYGNSSIAEYSALITSLELIVSHCCLHTTDATKREILLFGDSRVVIDDLQAELHDSSAHLLIYRERAKQLVSQIPRLKIYWIPRHRNGVADHLASSARGAMAADLLT